MYSMDISILGLIFPRTSQPTHVLHPSPKKSTIGIFTPHTVHPKNFSIHRHSIPLTHIPTDISHDGNSNPKAIHPTEHHATVFSPHRLTHETAHENFNSLDIFPRIYIHTHVLPKRQFTTRPVHFDVNSRHRQFARRIFFPANN